MLSAMRTVLLVDDQPLMLQALTNFLTAEDGFTVVGEAHDGREAYEKAHELKPDLILMDLKMPRLSGIEATRLITAELPDIHVIALTTFSTLDFVLPTLRAGAAGFLEKDARPDEILDALRSVDDDNLALSASVVRLLASYATSGGAVQDHQEWSGNDDIALAPRERSVLQHLASGLSNKEIANAMSVSPGSVKAYLGTACTKLGARDRLQAVVRAYELGLVKPRLGGPHPDPA